MLHAITPNRLLTLTIFSTLMLTPMLQLKAGQPVIWETSGRTELLKGDARGVSISDTGVLMLMFFLELATMEESTALLPMARAHCYMMQPSLTSLLWQLAAMGRCMPARLQTAKCIGSQVTAMRKSILIRLTNISGRSHFSLTDRLPLVQAITENSIGYVRRGPNRSLLY